MKTSKLVVCTVLTGVAGIFLTTAAQAQSGVFRVYAGVAPTTYRVTFDIPPLLDNLTAKASYLTASLGGTWVSPRGIYVDLSGQKSLSGKHDLWESDVLGGNGGKQKFSRDSYALTGGYIHVLSGGVNITGFGGYTHGKTTLYTPPGAGYSKDIFESNGIFVGAGAGVPALRGQFSGSVAVARMKGSWTEDNGTFDADADATLGFSVGGAYTHKLSESWGVTADVRIQQYKFDFPAQGGVSAYTVTEKVASVGVRVGYQF